MKGPASHVLRLRLQVDEKNLHHAQDNILRNKLQARTRPFKATPDDGPIMPDALGLEKQRLLYLCTI